MSNFSGCSASSQNCKCFEKLSKEEIDFVESRSVRVNYKRGEIICKQGSLASNIMYLEKGLAKVYIENGENTLVLKILTEGNLLGLSSLGNGNGRFQYSVMTYVDSVVKQIDVNCFNQLLSQNPLFSKEVIDILGANSSQINGRFFCLVHKQSFGRLADILLCLSERIFMNETFELPLSRKDLAELSGMSPETVIRILKKFNEDGLIISDNKVIKILDFNRLQKISEAG